MDQIHTTGQYHEFIRERHLFLKYRLMHADGSHAVYDTHDTYWLSNNGTAVVHPVWFKFQLDILRIIRNSSEYYNESAVSSPFVTDRNVMIGDV